jgi:hypothetical protein
MYCRCLNFSKEGIVTLYEVFKKHSIQTILNEDQMKPDGLMEVVINRLHFLIFLQEDKNEFGDGGSDPSTQAGLSGGCCWA